MKKIFYVLLVFAVLLVGAGCGNSENANNETEKGSENAEVVTFKVGITLAEDSHYYKGLEKFKELVKEKSGETINIEIFANGALGGERDMVEGVQLGTNDMVLSSTGPLGGFAPKVNVVDLPFLFQTREHAYKVLDGEIGQDLLAELESHNLKGLSWFENGFRHITNSKRAINTPEDLKGLKIRTMENEVHMASFTALGADPTPMSFTELFTALQQGVVDGEENPVPIVMTSKFYEVQKHLTLTGHFYSPAVLLVNKAKFEKLTADQQQAMLEAAQEAAVYERDLIQEMNTEFIGALKEKGMEIVENPDKSLFLEAVKPVYEKYQDTFGKDLIENIKKQAE